MNSINGTSFNDENQDCPMSAKLLLKFSVGSPKTYVLKSSTVKAKESTFAVASSNNQVKIYDEHGNLKEEYDHESSISHLKFSAINPNILFTSSLSGKIHVWDLRSQQCVQTFYDDSDGSLKPILCFDCNHSEELICAGTELIREDAFHLFWDLRSSKILGGYWDSHSADITQINFHPHHNTWMASSSVDGLINIFDLNEGSEDDALMQTINVEAPINNFTWKSDNVLSCTTSIEEHHLLKLEPVQSILSTSREKLSQGNKVRTDCMIDSLPIGNNFFLATGNNLGEVLLWKISEKRHQHNYTSVKYLQNGHTDVVRTVSYNDSTNVLLTGGDDGCVCLWKLLD